ncbi:MAG: PEP/pyruvate-binding domain-containing protein [Eubacterium sp.]|jgi:pyruvate,water dikinase|nr:PEP/pyruvate-binding domain-containing protein [Eubacterium sp.]
MAVLPYAVSLSSQNAINMSLFGAKATNLAKAMQLGLNVPDGFAISRVCTKDDFTHIAKDIMEILSPPIATRSSAINEDSSKKAFAGQFKTYLGIRTIEDLKQAFADVKDSGSTNLFQINHKEVVSPDKIAVFVQRMVNATRAGIAFSRDPITGESKVIIESNYGLGESVVHGYVTPDSIDYLDDETFKTFIGRKSIQVVLTDNGISTNDTSPDDSRRCSLTDKEIKEIANLTKKVECGLGFAADIEWAIDSDGILWLLQARPITTILKG